jgi:hypothetical protein
MLRIIILTWQRKSGTLKIIQRIVVILTSRIWAKYDMLQHRVYRLNIFYQKVLGSSLFFTYTSNKLEEICVSYQWVC